MTVKTIVDMDAHHLSECDEAGGAQETLVPQRFGDLRYPTLV
jgi:hypothetical protein